MTKNLIKNKEDFERLYKIYNERAYNNFIGSLSNKSMLRYSKSAIRNDFFGIVVVKDPGIF